MELSIGGRDASGSEKKEERISHQDPSNGKLYWKDESPHLAFKTRGANHNEWELTPGTLKKSGLGSGRARRVIGN